MLFVRFNEVQNHVTGRQLGQSWLVYVARKDLDDPVVLWGFGRERDAEIAKEFLESLSIDWLADTQEICRQIISAGFTGRNGLMKAACERLQW